MSSPVVAVAFSGGRDSTALLHATAAVAAPLGVRVVALHVHHGLSKHADAWLQQAAAVCARMGERGAPVTFASTSLTTRPARGDSIEAWARTARYAALRTLALAHGAPLVLLAHHRQDQAETLLLQALRGAGVAGLAGMPRLVVRDGIAWARPWLATPRAKIEAYVKQHRLDFVDDDSNADVRLARNRLRVAVWPALTAAFPAAEGSLAIAARWAHEAAVCAADLAALDLAALAHGRTLDLRAWRALSEARRGNALRAWLRRCMGTGRPAPMALVARLMAELATDRAARWPLPVGELRSHRGELTHATAASAAANAMAAVALRVTRAGARRVPEWHGSLCCERVSSGGVAVERLAALELRPRLGDERFQAAAARPPRALKKQFQAAGIAAWQRGGPLVYSGDALLFVPGLGIDHRALAPSGAPQMRLSWRPDESA